MKGKVKMSEDGNNEAVRVTGDNEGKKDNKTQHSRNGNYKRRIGKGNTKKEEERN